MFTLLVILAVITATLLILVVFVQSSKKEGLGGPLGSTGASQLLGIQKTGDLLEQLTWGLIISLFTLSLATTIFLKRGQEHGLSASPNLERVQERSLLPEPDQEDTTHTAGNSVLSE